MYICIFTYSLNKSMRVYQTVKIFMWVLRKDSHSISLGAGAAEELPLRLS